MTVYELRLKLLSYIPIAINNFTISKENVLISKNYYIINENTNRFFFVLIHKII
jgi:hypothetical protein